ncbi:MULTISPECIES: S24 family peptidase [unclassified Dyella]|uniref:helix-turn-helix domain-containing protein n=1 Tax=unclassified Dyella TaxID=2634549 RepID=UPI000C85678F|nr:MULTISPECIES: S24 family peptidase [unclassified Dyella]MDR3444790.1 S24 family peptidase [Dyella sp.]PMQ06145.1 LexA repressor [Dyella sp. AD56]
MQRFGDRLKAARAAKGLSQRALGVKAGVSGTSIKYWEDGTTDPENIRNAALQAAADALGVTVAYLKTGRDAPRRVGPASSRHIVKDDARLISVISYVQAGEWLKISDPANLDGLRPLVIGGGLAERLSETAFALEIEGEAMLDEFRQGDIVIVDPGIAPLPGDFVVAKLDNDTRAIFLKYRPRGVDQANHPVFELVPLNEDFEIIRVSTDNPGRVIGTMMEHRRHRRR